MNIKQHIPSFVSGFEPEEVEFNTLEELLDIEWVKPWKGKDFHQYSISDECLMIEYDEGRTWWVIGYLDEDAVDNIDLPEWKGGKEEE